MRVLVIPDVQAKPGGIVMRKMTIFEFLKILETANGDEVLELIHWFQCGRIEFTDIDYIAKMQELQEAGK